MNKEPEIYRKTFDTYSSNLLNSEPRCFYL